MPHEQDLTASPGIVASVNLAQVREIPLRGKLQKTGIWKLPVDHRVRARGVGLEGDTQADRAVHGGERKAVYTYSVEDYRWWEQTLGAPLPPGTFGENLTLEGIAINDVLIKERWRIGSAEFEVTQPRQPCWKLGVKMEDSQFPRRFSEAGRPGAYLSIVEEGDLGRGDTVEVIHRPAHPMTIGLLAHLIYTNLQLASLLIQLIEEPLSPEDWKQLLGATLADPATGVQ
ncbi:MAG: MOSC domain-containing protein [Actinomycetota bacterium]